MIAEINCSINEMRIILLETMNFMLEKEYTRNCKSQFLFAFHTTAWYNGKVKKLSKSQQNKQKPKPNTNTHGGNPMAISYKKLWKLLIDKGMLKKDLRAAAGLSTNVIAKMGKNQDVSTESLRKICKALKCDLTDIVELIDEKN